MDECPYCEFPVRAMGLTSCPKCDSCGELPRKNGASARGGVLEVDIAHSGETWEAAKMKLDRAVDDALYHRYAGVKIIHGWGSSTGGHAVIGPRAQAYLRHLAEHYGGRFTSDRNTSGASIIWFNR